MTLTKSDFNQIDSLLEEKLTQLKSDIFDKIDPILNEVTTARDERALIEDRLEKLEDIHPDGAHPLSS